MPIRTSQILKNLSCRSLIAAGVTMMATAMAPAAMAADNWPDKPLHLIVGFPAGSSPDLSARALAEPLEKSWARPSLWKTVWVQAAISPVNTYQGRRLHLQRDDQRQYDHCQDAQPRCAL